MPSQITATGVVGPGIAVTATVYQNVSSFLFDTVNKMVTIFFLGGVPPVNISIGAQTTFTLTLVAPNNYTMSIS